MARQTYYLGEQGQERTKVSENRMWAIVNSPLISAQIDVNAATGLTNALTIPAGYLVTQVAVIADTAVSGGSGDVDVGDGTTADLYFDGLSALAANVIANAGAPGTASADPHAGKYYASEDTIDVTINATAAAGTIRVIADLVYDAHGIYT